jgi:hypothetical protein
MSNEKDAGRLILADLALFNEAKVFFEKEIQPAVLDAFNEAVKDWANQHGWSSNAEWDQDNGKLSLWLAPQWSFKDKKGGDDANPYFAFYWLDGGKSPSYPLADLCGVGSERMGFWFEVKDKGWKKAVKPVVADYAEKLKPHKFVLKDIDFYRPLCLDPARLPDAWSEGDYDEILAPLVETLDALEKSWPIFNDLVTKVRA